MRVEAYLWGGGHGVSGGGCEEPGSVADLTLGLGPGWEVPGRGDFSWLHSRLPLAPLRTSHSTQERLRRSPVPQH